MPLSAAGRAGPCSIAFEIIIAPQILLRASHLGDLTVLREALALAREDVAHHRA